MQGVGERVWGRTHKHSNCDNLRKVFVTVCAPWTRKKTRFSNFLAFWVSTSEVPASNVSHFIAITTTPVSLFRLLHFFSLKIISNQFLMPSFLYFFFFSCERCVCFVAFRKEFLMIFYMCEFKFRNFIIFQTVQSTERYMFTKNRTDQTQLEEHVLIRCEKRTQEKKPTHLCSVNYETFRWNCFSSIKCTQNATSFSSFSLSLSSLLHINPIFTRVPQSRPHIVSYFLYVLFAEHALFN